MILCKSVVQRNPERIDLVNPVIENVTETVESELEVRRGVVDLGSLGTRVPPSSISFYSVSPTTYLGLGLMSKISGGS